MAALQCRMSGTLSYSYFTCFVVKVKKRGQFKVKGTRLVVLLLFYDLQWKIFCWYIILSPVKCTVRKLSFS